MRTAVQAVCFDLDSTLRDSRQRHHLTPIRNPDNPEITWDTYSAAGAKDTPIIGAIALTSMFFQHYQVHIVSGSGESARPQTTEWLLRNGVRWDFLKLRTGDQPNGEFKVANIEALRAKGTECVLFVEDWGPVAREIEEKTSVPVLVVNPLYPCQNCEFDVLAGLTGSQDNAGVRPL